MSRVCAIPAQFVIPESVWTWIHGLGRLGLIRLGVVVLGLVVIPDSVWTWIQGLGGLGLILLGLADNTPFVSAPPGSEDVFLILLSAHHPHWWVYYAFMATVGEVLGGYLGYRLAAKGGQETFEKKVGKPRAEKIYKQFEKRGVPDGVHRLHPTAALSFQSRRDGGGGDAVSAQEVLLRTFRWTCCAFFCRGLSGRVYGQQMIGFFSRHYRPLLYVLISVAVAGGIGALIYFVWYRPKQRRGSGAHLAGRKEKTVSSSQGIQ